MSVVTATRREMSFCPGCSHSAVLVELGAGLERAGLRPEQVCLVSDIGCIGTADRYFACHTFHGLHGRSLTYAEGIKRQRPELTVVVLIGDGGCGIGTAHLVHAARRGVGLKVLVCNNFTFGMTGGQHSVTTPMGGITATTPAGSDVPPLDIAQLALVSGADYVARCSALEADFPRYIDAVLRAPGFALLDIWELCVAYYAPSNKLTPPGLHELSRQLGLPLGTLRARVRPAADCSAPGPSREGAPRPAALPQRISAGSADTSRGQAAQVPSLPWSGRHELLVAGAAGERIRSAVGVFGEIAVAGGLFAAQTDDYPIFVRRGHSLSSLIVSDRPVTYAGTSAPELLILQSPDGLQRLGGLAELPAETLIVANDELELPPTPARVCRVSLARAGKGIEKTTLALALLTFGVVRSGWLPGEVLVQAAERVLRGKFREANLRAIRAGLAGAEWVTG